MTEGRLTRRNFSEFADSSTFRVLSSVPSREPALSHDQDPENPNSWRTTVQRPAATSTPEQPTFELDINGSEIGPVFGASIGQAIGGKNVLIRVAAGTVLSAVLGNVGESLDLYFSDTSPDASFTDADGKAFGNFDADLGKAFQGQAVGAVSGFLVGELAEALGFDGDGFGAGLLRATAGSLTTTALNNFINNASAVASGTITSTPFFCQRWRQPRCWRRRVRSPDRSAGPLARRLATAWLSAVPPSSAASPPALQPARCWVQRRPCSPSRSSASLCSSAR